MTPRIRAQIAGKTVQEHGYPGGVVRVPIERRVAALGGWFRRHRDALIVGLIVTVVGGLIVGVVLLRLARDSESVAASSGSPVAPEAKTREERAPITGLGSIRRESSVELYGGDLVVSINAIVRFRGSLRISGIVLRAEGSQRCEFSDAVTGSAFAIAAPRSLYRVEFRGVSRSKARIVAFRSARGSRRTGCILALPRVPLPSATQVP